MKPLMLINLERIQLLIDSGRINAAQPITLKTLKDCGYYIKYGVKIAARVNCLMHFALSIFGRDLIS